MKLALLFTILLLISLLACTREVRTKKLYPGKELTPETLIDKVSLLDISTVKASVTLKIVKNGKPAGTFPGVLVYQHPDRALLRIFGPFGITAFDLLFKQGNLRVYIPQKNAIYEGNVPFKRLLPDREGLLNAPKRIKETETAYKLFVFGKEKDKLVLKAIYSFSKEGLQWRAVEVFGSNTRAMTMNILHHNNEIPDEIEVLTDRYSLQIKLKDIELNKPVKEEAFILPSVPDTFPLTRLTKDAPLNKGPDK